MQCAQSLCINWKGDHPSYSRSCPKWKFKKEIQMLKISQKLTYPEAPNLIQSRTPRPGLSYSTTATSNLTQTVGTQTRTVGTQISAEPHHISSFKTKAQIALNKAAKSPSASPSKSNVTLPIFSNKLLSGKTVLTQKPLNTKTPLKTSNAKLKKPKSKNINAPGKNPKFMINRFEVLQSCSAADSVEPMCSEGTKMDIPEIPTHTKHPTVRHTKLRVSSSKHENKMTNKERKKFYKAKLACDLFNEQQSKEEEPLSLYASDLED